MLAAITTESCRAPLTKLASSRDDGIPWFPRVASVANCLRFPQEKKASSGLIDQGWSHGTCYHCAMTHACLKHNHEKQRQRGSALIFSLRHYAEVPEGSPDIQREKLKRNGGSQQTVCMVRQRTWVVSAPFGSGLAKPGDWYTPRLSKW